MITLSLSGKSRMHPLMIMLGSAMTSFSAVFVKLSHAHPDAAGFYRNFFGLCALSVLLFIRRERPVSGRSPLLITAL
ncbi:MAG TPA: EamA/RhaT family transporter, partial [Spirochaetota bacterium]|nr:EamA/RhaT family transporter [Spirochaetota bacterium]